MEYYYLERKVGDVEIEIISFVVDRSVKLTIPPNRLEVGRFDSGLVLNSCNEPYILSQNRWVTKPTGTSYNLDKV